MDLHALTRAFGTDAVARVIGCTRRALEDLRRGYTALTIDDLYQLQRNYPAFDMGATVDRVALVREENGRSRKKRRE
jgi:hypothetical protein|tara:strand:- start:330 stop:560 length:231 start_codon:yes stop_codon:yes gene_type:complete